MMTSLYSSLLATGFTFAPILAQAEEGGARGYTISWAVILLGLILGLTIALRPTKREDNVKVPKRG